MGNRLKQLWERRCRCKRSQKAKKKASDDEVKTENELWQEYYGPYLHFLPFLELCSRLEANPAQGLTHEMAKRKLERNGKNVLPIPPKRIRLVWRYFNHCFSTLGVALFLCAIACFFLYNHEDEAKPNEFTNPGYLTAGCFLLICFFLGGLMPILHEDRTKAIVVAINDLMPTYCTVIREGMKEIILSQDVVVGDVVPISYGQRLPADLRFFSTSGLEVDNVALTGTSEPWQINPLPGDGTQRYSYSKVEY